LKISVTLPIFFVLCDNILSHLFINKWFICSIKNQCFIYFVLKSPH
jgi:hypothetical protein